MIEFKTLLREARDIVILALRDYFQEDDEVPVTLKWDPDVLKSKVFISDRSPEEIRGFPAIVVKSTNTREQRMGFRQFGVYDMPDGTVNSQVKRIIGKAIMSMTLVAASRSTAQLDIMMDLLWTSFLVSKYDAIESKGLLFVPNTMSIGADDVYMWDETTPIQRNTVSFQVVGEWFKDIKMTEAVLEKLDIENTNGQRGVLRSSFNQNQDP